jgi:glycine oxidase
MQQTDVAIIGGGVIGCLTAYRLRKKGMRVMVFDQGKIGGQASSAATGLLAPFKLFAKPHDPYLILQRASLAMFPSLVEELEASTGMTVGYHQTGSLRLAPLQQEKKLEQWIAQWNDLGVSMDLIQRDHLHAFEPSLAPEYSLAVSIPSEPQVTARLFMLACEKGAQQSGAILLPGTRVVDIEEQGGQGVMVKTSQGETITCQYLVLAAGAWSGLLSSQLHYDLPVSPIHGQSLLLRQPAIPVGHIIFGKVKRLWWDQPMKIEVSPQRLRQME